MEFAEILCKIAYKLKKMTARTPDKKESINWSVVFLIIIVTVGIYYRSKSASQEIPTDTRKQLPNSVLESPEDLNALVSLMREYERKKAATEDEIKQIYADYDQREKKRRGTMDVYRESDVDWLEKIEGSRKRKELEAGLYADLVEFSKNFSKIAQKYFPSAESVINNLNVAKKEATDAELDSLDAWINYNQAELDKSPISFEGIADKGDKLAKKEKVLEKAEADFYNEFGRILENR